MHKEFYVTVFSNNSMNKYTNNVLSCFTNYIDSPLGLKENWEVGITEMYHNKFISSYKADETCVNLENDTAEKRLCSYDHNELNKKYKSQKLMDFMFIHTDIIKPRHVGDQMIRCIKVLPANTLQDDYIKFGRIEYYPIEMSYIRSVSIAILDSESNRINFIQSILPTMITLHFRKKDI